MSDYSKLENQLIEDFNYPYLDIERGSCAISNSKSGAGLAKVCYVPTVYNNMAFELVMYTGKDITFKLYNTIFEDKDRYTYLWIFNLIKL